MSFCGEEEAESCLFWILSGRNENSELSDFSWSTKGLSVGDIGQVVNMRLDVGSVQMWMVEVEKVKVEEGRSRRRQKGKKRTWRRSEVNIGKNVEGCWSIREERALNILVIAFVV